jgi:hypothetical protein
MPDKNRINNAMAQFQQQPQHDLFVADNLMHGARSFLCSASARLSLVAVIIVMAIVKRADAQQLEPRTYTNTPVGMNFLIAGYGYADGGVLSDPSIPLKNADIQLHETILAYARGIDTWGRSGKIDVIVPYARASGSGEFNGIPGERDVSGPGDPKLRVSVNLVGAPALSLAEFMKYRQDFVVGASLQVGVPLGQYDNDKLLNIGTNRWTIKPEVGISKTLGSLTLELAASASFYTDNTDFFEGRTLEQDPIYALQGHLIFSRPSGIWLALDGTYYTGGSTTIDGMDGLDNQSNSRMGLTVALPVSRYHSLKLYCSTGVSTRTGGDFDAVGIAWQVRWGDGL